MMDWHKYINRVFILIALWLSAFIIPHDTFSISVYGIAFGTTLVLLFIWSFEGSWWNGFKQEIRNLVRHREDGGANSVTAGMFLLGVVLFLVTTIVWIISVIFEFLIDPNWYQFCERVGYVLMGARPVQMGAGYIRSSVQNLYKQRRRGGRNKEDEDDQAGIYSPDELEELDPELLNFEKPPRAYGKSGKSQPAPVTKPKAEPQTKAEKFIFKFWAPAKQMEKETGLSAIFTLAQGGIERGWNIASTGYNLFGITASETYTGNKVLLRTKEEHATTDVKYPKIHSIRWDAKKQKHIYDCERYFRVYNSYEECFRDRLKVLQKPHFSHAWPYRGDPYMFVQKLQSGRKKYATGSDYVGAMYGFIKQTERIVKKLGLV